MRRDQSASRRALGPVVAWLLLAATGLTPAEEPRVSGFLPVRPGGGAIRENPGPAGTGTVADRPGVSCLECHASWNEGRLDRFAGSAHGKLGCGACHASVDEVPHGPAAVPGEAACARCHADAARGFAASIHKAAGARGVKAFQRGCAACHGDAHAIAKALPGAQPEEACARCHGSKAMSARLGLPGRAWSAYENSIHGQKRLLGGRTTPGCVDCHGSHHVTSPADVASTLSLVNRARSCAKCHEHATPVFSLTFSHDAVDRESAPVAHLVSWFYCAAIVCVLLFCGTLIALELGSWLVRRRLGRPLRQVHADRSERFTPVQRAQHAVVLVAFVLLVLTGMPLLAASVDSQTRLLALFGGVERAALVHRAAGTILIAATLWHAGWLWRLRRRGEPPRTMVPGVADLVELREQLRTHLLLRDELPGRAGKYGWVEKLEYFGFAWGSVVMALTGLLLWFPVAASAVLPAGGLLVAQLVHGFEAILATLFVFLWHFYQVHLRPNVFPMNWTWLTGKEK